MPLVLRSAAAVIAPAVAWTGRVATPAGEAATTSSYRANTRGVVAQPRSRLRQGSRRRRYPSRRRAAAPARLDRALEGETDCLECWLSAQTSRSEGRHRDRPAGGRAGTKDVVPNPPSGLSGLGGCATLVGAELARRGSCALNPRRQPSSRNPTSTRRWSSPAVDSFRGCVWLRQVGRSDHSGLLRARPLRADQAGVVAARPLRSRCRGTARGAARIRTRLAELMKS